MKKSILTSAVMLAASLMITSSAWADTFLTGNFSGEVWRVPGNLQDAPTSDPSNTLGRHVHFQHDQLRHPSRDSC